VKSQLSEITAIMNIKKSIINYKLFVLDMSNRKPIIVKNLEATII